MLRGAKKLSHEIRSQNARHDNWPLGTTEQILALRVAGKTKPQIVKLLTHLGVTINKVLSDIQRSEVRLTKDQKTANRPRIYTKEQREKVLELRQHGIKLDDIVSQTGIPQGSVRAELLKARVTLTKEQRLTNSTQTDPQIIKKAVEMRLHEIPVKEIGKELGVPWQTAKKWFVKRRITIPEEKRKENSAKSFTPEHLRKLLAGQTPEVIARRSVSIKNRYKSDFLLIETKRKQTKEWWEKLSVEEREILNIKKRGERSGMAIKANDKFSSASERYQNMAAEMGGKYLGPEGYSPTSKKIKWSCKDGHEFYAAPYTVRGGHWCPSCAHKISKSETEIYDFVKNLTSDAISRDRTVIAPKELDIYIPSRKIGIEYHGLYWHSELRAKTKFNVLIKHMLAEEADIRLIIIFEDEWLFKKEAVKRYLKGILGFRKRIGARKLEIKKGKYRDWVEENHLQGSSYGKDYALFDRDNLMAVATFAKPNASRGRKPQEGVWELSRYCIGTVGVTGGLSKLIKAFQKDHPEAKELISYSDNRWSQGNLYLSSGFNFVRVNKPSFWFFTQKLNRIHRFGLRKKILIKNGGKPNKTGWELAQDFGYNRIWDAGTTLWSKKLT